MKFNSVNSLVVGRDEFLTKEGNKRYSLTFANGTGSPLKLSCSAEQFAMVVPMAKIYEIEANFDTNGYNTYGSLVTVREQAK